MASWGVVGIVERFEDSARAYRSLYQPIISDFEFSTFWENNTARNSAPIDAQIEKIAEELGDTLFEKIKTHNSLDESLYHYGNTVLTASLAIHSIHPYRANKLAN